MLVKRAGDFNILLDDVSITNLAFSTAYSAAVEAKQVAQQDSERAKYIVERAIQEKRTIVIRAEGEAKSAMLIGAVSIICGDVKYLTSCQSLEYVLISESLIVSVQAIRDNPAFLQLRRIEAAKEVCTDLLFLLHSF